MKIAPRILVPVALAALCATALMVFLWWQLKQSAGVIADPAPSAANGSMLVSDRTAGTTNTLPAETDDLSLLHLRRGDLLSLRSEWAEAEKEYAASVKAGGGLPALRKLAQIQMQRRDVKGATATLRKMKSANARPEDVLLLETLIQLRAGELVDAATLLESAEDSPQKHYGMALLSVIQGNHDATKAELAAVEAGWDPVLRSYARTISAAYQEFSLFPDGSDLHLVTLLSRALAQVQECELALPLLLQVTSSRSDYRDAWVVQGYCELTTERPAQALSSLEHAYALDPQKPEIQYFLGRAHAANQEHQNAITFLEYALQNGFEPQSEIRRLIAQYALQMGNAGLALEQYEALLAEEGVTLESYEGYVSAAHALGRPEEAFARATEATIKWPTDARAFELLGILAYRLERFDEARSALEKALELNPSLIDAEETLSALNEK